MSKLEVQLCSLLLKEHFGEIVQKVGSELLRSSSKPLLMTAHDTKQPLEKVKRALCVLLQHNMGHVETNSRGFIEYKVDSQQVMLRLRYPRYIFCTKTLYGDSAELLIEELLTNGRMTMSAVIERVLERLAEATNGKNVNIKQVVDNFTSLVQTRFIQRCSAPKVHLGNDDPEQGPGIVTEKNMYDIPEVKTHLFAQKLKQADDGTPPTKRRKLEEEEKQPDCGIYWRVSADRFHQYFRDQALVAAVARRLDKKAAETLRTLLRLAETTSDPWAPTTAPISKYDVIRAVAKDTSISEREVEPYLAILADDALGFVSKIEERAGGMYVVNTCEGVKKLCEGVAISVVQEKFGSRCSRIFRLLLKKKYLEQKQIEELAMIPAKDAKECTYRMFNEGFISVQEIPRTPDHAPSRTFFLFHVNLQKFCHMLRERCYKTYCNLIARREMEMKEHRRLLEKQQRVVAIVSTLQQNGADEVHIQEVEDMITPPEKTQLERVKHVTNKLEHSEIQLDDTMFLLECWLNYHHT